MNSWKLNGHAGHYFRQAVIRGLSINNSDIYKTVKDISRDGVIETKDGKKYYLELKEIKN